MTSSTPARLATEERQTVSDTNEAADGSVRKVQTEPGPGSSETFDGQVTSELIHHNTDKEVKQLRVHFHDGAQTHWHIHLGGDQVLYFTEGKGFAQELGKEVIECEAGDIIHVPDGTRHIHGAMPGSDATHIAISQGETIWDHDPRYPG